MKQGSGTPACKRGMSNGAAAGVSKSKATPSVSKMTSAPDECDTSPLTGEKYLLNLI